MPLPANSVSPAVRRFVKAYPLQTQLISERVAIHSIENSERIFGQILRGRDAVKNHGLVPRQGTEKLDNSGVACIYQKCMVPMVDQMPFRQRLDFREIHHHAVSWIPLFFYDLAGKGNFENIAMPMQVAALAPVIGNTMTSIKLKATGDKHDELGDKTGRDYIIGGFHAFQYMKQETNGYAERQ